MSYNELAYIIYVTATVYIIYWVGKLFHTNGRVFILRLFGQNEAATDTTNNLLLLAYYLFNTGYAVIQISFWENITGPESMITSIAGKTGLLILILAVTHYFNMALIHLLSRKIPFIP